MPLTRFDRNQIRQQLAGFQTQQLVAVAAFWAQRLIPVYRRFSTLKGFGSVAEVQRCLDLAWLAASAEHIVRSSDVSRWEDRLLELAPEIDMSPVLAYGAMECASATREALEAATGNSIDHAMASVDSYSLVIRSYLLRRDHRGVLIATK